MTRECKDDYQTLTSFLGSYSINSTTCDPDFEILLKRLHSKLFSLLTLVVEFEALNQVNAVYSQDSIAYFFECTSDLAQALFAWVHGAYKPAALVLRSSIETFVKASCGTECPQMFVEKSLYKILDDAQNSIACGNVRTSGFFSRVRNEYATLCSIAHSATADRQTQIQALRIFPKFDKKTAESFADRFTVLTESYLAIILANNMQWFHQMHFKNRQNVLDSLPKPIKQQLFDAT